MRFSSEGYIIILKYVCTCKILESKRIRSFVIFIIDKIKMILNELKSKYTFKDERIVRRTKDITV